MNIAAPEVAIADVEPPTRLSRIEAYLYDKTDDCALEIAEDFAQEGSPMHSTGVLIPVAAHQEATKVYHSMYEYALQQGADDFTILLLLNYPLSRHDDEGISKTAEAVERAKADFPHLDIRYSLQCYSESPTIGQIRKDLWDAAAYVALHDGLYDTPGKDFIGVNHDIDTEYISPHYIRNIQRYYSDLQAELDDPATPESPHDVLPPRFTQVKHAYPFDTHPNIAKAILWTDFSMRQILKNGVYEEGMVFPLAHYASKGGFVAASKTYETRELAPTAISEHGIPGTGMDTSPRRYIDRFGQHGYSGLWTEESFGAEDTCREAGEKGDITKEQLEDHILDSLEKDLNYVCLGQPKVWQNAVERRVSELKLGDANSSSFEDFRQYIAQLLEPRIKLASNVLRRAVDSPTLASIAADEFVIANLADRYAADLEKEARAHFKETAALEKVVEMIERRRGLTPKAASTE